MYMDQNGLVLEGTMQNDRGQEFAKPTKKKILQTSTAATAPRCTTTVTPVQMSVLRFDTLVSKPKVKKTSIRSSRKEPKQTQVDPGFLMVDPSDMLAVSIQVVNYCSARICGIPVDVSLSGLVNCCSTGICGFPEDVSLSGHHDGVLSLFTRKNEHKPTMMARWFQECVMFFREYVTSDVDHFFEHETVGARKRIEPVLGVELLVLRPINGVWGQRRRPASVDILQEDLGGGATRAGDGRLGDTVRHNHEQFLL